MDHLPRPANPAHPAVAVPFHGLGYMTCSFAAYLEDFQVTEQDLYESTTKSGKSGGDIAQFLQSWLFFGLLYEILSENAPDLNDLIVPVQDGKRLISTVKLPIAVAAWMERVKLLEVEAKSSQYEEQGVCFETVESVLRRLPIENPDLVAIHLTQEAFISIASVVQYLKVASTEAHGETKEPTLGLYSSTDYLTDGMISQGWCPNEISFLRCDADVEAFYYVSNLTRSATRDHGHCTKEKCLANDVHPQQYVTEHAREFCNLDTCKNISVSQEEMLVISKSGSVPLVLFKHGENGMPEIQLVGSRQGSRYVAISHVRSEGLGNGVDNALPQCQLAFLSHAVNGLYPSSNDAVPFWIDTLCFPLQPQEAHNMTEARMRATYEDADEVLVLDSFLRCLQTESLKDEECLIRVFCTRWMRRLWTLYEVHFARSVRIKFSDSVMDLDAVLAKIRSGSQRGSFTDRLSYRGINRYIWKRIIPLRARATIGSRSKMTLIAPAVQYRSTSATTDEPLCLGALLNLDTESILSVPENERMKQFWMLLGEAGGLTRGALFAHGSKIRAKGYGWAPATILVPSTYEIITNARERGALGKEGLEFECTGFLLTGKKPITSAFHFKDFEGNWYKVFADDDIHYYWRDEEQKSPRSSADLSHYPTVHAVLVREQLDTPTPLGHRRSPVGGVLVAVEGLEDGLVTVRFLTHVAVTMATRGESTGFETVDRVQSEGVDTVVRLFPPSLQLRLRAQLELFAENQCILYGRQTPETQKWCCL